MVAGFTGEFVKSKDKWKPSNGEWRGQQPPTFSDDLALGGIYQKTYEKVMSEKDEKFKACEKRCHVAGCKQLKETVVKR